MNKICFLNLISPLLAKLHLFQSMGFIYYYILTDLVSILHRSYQFGIKCQMRFFKETTGSRLEHNIVLLLVKLNVPI